MYRYCFCTITDSDKTLDDAEKFEATNALYIVMLHPWVKSMCWKDGWVFNSDTFESYFKTPGNIQKLIKKATKINQNDLGIYGYFAHQVTQTQMQFVAFSGKPQSMVRRD